MFYISWERAYAGQKKWRNDTSPLVLGMAGIGLCAVWVVGTSCLCSVQEAAMALFTALVQGVLVTGLAVWALRRLEKGKEEK